MPAFLENKLKDEYPGEAAAPYKIMNKIGAMRGNKETPKGAAMQRKHNAKMKKGGVAKTLGTQLMEA
jgi:hypothetical protein